ncbi:hypothetical protein CDAR_216531 [Caerostris darwini]|uniref:C2H2-type domain-containing protein n=1 Tax=Caerostris darwini TaxID=1538125 RepID=A0AAV4SZL3_9ARAC|nr:hypothetical protein CDAR_216531 [Caerostris darwini]
MRHLDFHEKKTHPVLPIHPLPPSLLPKSKRKATTSRKTIQILERNFSESDKRSRNAVFKKRFYACTKDGNEWRKTSKLQMRHLDFHEKEIHPVFHPPTQHPRSFPKAREKLPLPGVCASSNFPFQMLMPDFRPDPLIGLPDI